MYYIPYTESIINYYKSLEKEFKLQDVKVLMIVERGGNKNLEEILKSLDILNNILIVTKKPGDDFISKELIDNIKDSELRELKYITFSECPKIDNIECNEYILLITDYCVLPLPSFNKKMGIKKYKDFFRGEDSIKGAMLECITNKNLLIYTINTK